MRYTDKQIQDACQKYYERIDRVMEVLRLVPLNERGIHIVNHASNNFLITTIIEPGLGCGRIESEVIHCRELYLETNPDFPRDKSLVNKFADAPLRIEQSPPFFFIAYDTLLWII